LLALGSTLSRFISLKTKTFVNRTGKKIALTQVKSAYK